jgi:hypothetical protein
MKTVTRILSLAALALAPLGAAHATSEPIEFTCGIVDPTAFLNYVENNHPTLVELKGVINCLTIVMPGDRTTMEIRVDNSRFFAITDGHGRIVGGSFR